MDLIYLFAHICCNLRSAWPVRRCGIASSTWCTFNRGILRIHQGSFYPSQRSQGWFCMRVDMLHTNNGNCQNKFLYFKIYNVVSGALFSWKLYVFQIRTFSVVPFCRMSHTMHVFYSWARKVMSRSADIMMELSLCPRSLELEHNLSKILLFPLSCQVNPWQMRSSRLFDQVSKQLILILVSHIPCCSVDTPVMQILDM